MSEASNCQWWKPAPGKVMIDIGFGPGTWTLDALERGARVYAFDPKPYAMQLLMAEIATKGYTRCTALPLGVWSSTCKLKFGVNSFREGLDNHFQDGKEAWVTSLDDYIGKSVSWAEEHIDAINMDCEGSELEVVRGGKRTISICKPTLIIEVHEMYGVDKSELVKEIKKLAAYEVFDDNGFLIATVRRQVAI